MLCGLFNCGGGRADEVEAFGRLERHAGSAGLVVRGPLAVAQSSRAGGMAALTNGSGGVAAALRATQELALRQ